MPAKLECYQKKAKACLGIGKNRSVESIEKGIGERKLLGKPDKKRLSLRVNG